RAAAHACCGREPRLRLLVSSRLTRVRGTRRRDRDATDDRRRLAVMAGTGKAHLRDGDVVLRVEDLVVEFPISRRATVSAVYGISFDVLRGETLGIVGESGCGKSTTGRAIMQITKPTSGSVVFEGTDLTELSRADLRSARTRVQMIFQDPISSLNPRRIVRDSVKDPLEIWQRGTPDERNARVDAVLENVGIDPDRAA